MKLLVHNQTVEFEKLTDSPRTRFDVLVEETDPALVTMQLDLGWVNIAGVDQSRCSKGRTAGAWLASIWQLTARCRAAA